MNYKIKKKKKKPYLEKDSVINAKLQWNIELNIVNIVKFVFISLITIAFELVFLNNNFIGFRWMCW